MPALRRHRVILLGWTNPAKEQPVLELEWTAIHQVALHLMQTHKVVEVGEVWACKWWQRRWRRRCNPGSSGATNTRNPEIGLGGGTSGSAELSHTLWGGGGGGGGGWSIFLDQENPKLSLVGWRMGWDWWRIGIYCCKPLNNRRICHI